ncbi:VOC family protein [Zobellia galactanivorans]|uniref:Possible dioxygenase n=1 Tax=Zobellia galactanivorans (strain DSM 12802 / CCUG 47099 / CIP 106680 / NCIMB 13871 / Dsij) TaxID=63186 RepID=G0L692_ZOBGA|nr:dioxygenase [Zobellia galactanivorans]CAZ96789.1 Possible dioxygenase [Zobellia galactanivorans]
MQIKELTIYSSKIKEQSEFYAQVLGLPQIEESANKLSFQCGKSILHIEFNADTSPYHFAINIPANKELEALNWLKSKVKILKDGDREIQDFDFWNAKAIYFYDSDQNIVELIARKNLNNPSDQKFGLDQFLEISEIGMPTTDIQKKYDRLARLTGIEIFDGGFERFCAIGDEHGLFICIDKALKDWYPTNDKAFSSAFEIELVEKGKAYRLAYKNGKITPLGKPNS